MEIMEILGVTTVVAIVVICYLIGQGAKLITGIKDEFIPVIVGVAGGILGIVGLYVMPDFPAKYKKDYPFLKEVDSLALANVQLNLQGAIRQKVYHLKLICYICYRNNIIY